MNALPPVLEHLLELYPELTIKKNEHLMGWDIRYPHGDKYASTYVENVSEDYFAEYIKNVEHLKNDFK